MADTKDNGLSEHDWNFCRIVEKSAGFFPMSEKSCIFEIVAKTITKNKTKMKKVIVKRKGKIVQEFQTPKEALAYVDFICRHSKEYCQWDFELEEN